MHNLILHNRRLFGYAAPALEAGTLTPDNVVKWSARLQKSYEKANEFDNFLRCKPPLTVDVLRHMFEIWRPTSL